MFSRGHAAVYLIVLMFMAGPLQAETAHHDDAAALQGYSPVSYFTVGGPELGDPHHTARHDGDLYYFTSADQVAVFESDPERYVPAYGAYCPYNLALGRRLAIHPTNFKILGGQLLLFHRSDEVDGRERFEESERQAELLERANREFVLMEF